MTDARPILVIGGTRGTGLLVAQRLGRQGSLVRVLARDPAQAQQRLGPTVELVAGDLTRLDTLAPALHGVSHLIFTAGCRSGRPVREAQVRATEFEGVLNTLTAAEQAGFTGRFLYMTASGVTARSLSTFFLNLYKGNTLRWRRRAEQAIRDTRFPYTIIRAAFLLNRSGGKRAITVTQQPLPLSLRYRIARADVADAFVAALADPQTIRTTFEVAWAAGTLRLPWSVLFQTLKPDSSAPGPAAGMPSHHSAPP